MVDLALKTLLHDKLRFFITTAGVAFAVTLVLVQGGLFAGILDNSTVAIDHIDADLWVTSRNTPNIDFPHAFPETFVQRVRSIPGVARADNLMLTFMNMTLPTGAEETTVVYGLENYQRWNFPWDVTEGQFADLRRGKFMALDDSDHKRLGPYAVGDYREVLGRRMKIIARTRGVRSFTTTPVSFLDYDRAQSLVPGLKGKTAYILIKVAPGAEVAAVADEVRRVLPFNDVYTKAAWAKRTRDYWIVNTGLGFNMFLTVFLGCLVGLVVVAQTLYTSTMEHLKEFGTVKAIGGSNRDIYKMLARQATLSAFAGYALGLIPALSLGPVVAKADLKLIIPLSFMGIVLVGTVLMCLAAALVSFRKVAGIDPALVFRT